MTPVRHRESARTPACACVYACGGDGCPAFKQGDEIWFHVTFQLMTAFPSTLEAYIAAYEKRVQITILLPALQQQGIQHLMAHLCHIFTACLASGIYTNL